MMKAYHIIILLALVITCACNNKKPEDINWKMKYLNKKTVADSIQTSMKSYYEFSEVLQHESELPTDSVILAYKNLLNKYPNSFWTKEAESRIIALKKTTVVNKDQKNTLKKPLHGEKAVYCE